MTEPMFPMLDPPPGGLHGLRRRLAGEPRRRAVRIAWEAALASVAAGTVALTVLLGGDAPAPVAVSWPSGETAMVPAGSSGDVALARQPVSVPGVAVYWVAGMTRVDPSPLPEPPSDPG